MHDLSVSVSRLVRPALLSALALLLAACQVDPDVPALEAGQATQAIVNGTANPQTVELTDGEILAIGWLHPRGQTGANFCTGTLITPTLVATASHCTSRSRASDIGFGIGPAPSRPTRTFNVTAIGNHPSRDVALLVLAEDATEAVAGLTPIPANTAAITNADIGKALDAAGYGDTYNTNPAGRWFARVYLYSVTSTEIVVDGRGEQGICYGDSGGPVIWEGPNGPVVLGVESWGDPTCVDRDYLTRLDAVYDDFIVPIMNGELPPDPCEGIPSEGLCDGDVYKWCRRGELRERDCADLGTTCGFIDAQGRHGCTCGDVDFAGRCDGDVVEYCEDGTLRRFDCSFQRLTCGYISAEVGYYCVDQATVCGPGTEDGACQGTVLVTCSQGVTHTTNCGTAGLACIEDQSGAARCDEPDGPVDPEDPVDPGPVFPTPQDPAENDPNGGGRAGSDGCTQAASPASASPFALALLALLAASRRRRQR
jgi:MYXO-CTERM domain-containing protein